MNVSHEIPGIEEYVSLREAAGLGSKDAAAAEAALGRTIFAATVRDDGAALIGMGRIIGDGGCYYRIVDVAVHPSRRGEGVEEALMAELLAYLDRSAPADAEVTVVSDAASIPFYQKHGFKLIYPERYGMSRPRRGTEARR
jgi:ribosomal protein S18 acetylase RimI-like enzyme